MTSQHIHQSRMISVFAFLHILACARERRMQLAQEVYIDAQQCVYWIPFTADELLELAYWLDHAYSYDEKRAKLKGGNTSLELALPLQD